MFSADYFDNFSCHNHHIIDNYICQYKMTTFFVISIITAFVSPKERHFHDEYSKKSEQKLPIFSEIPALNFDLSINK